MRTRNRALIVLAAVTVFVTAFAVPAQAGPEGTLVSRINSSRSAAGLAPLETYWDLTDDARAHASRMAADQRVYHNPSLASVTSVWQGLGENVGVGYDASSLHDDFMASSGHRANILGDFNYVGVGATTDENGLVWATVIFMRAEPGLNAPATTTTVPPAPTTSTTTTLAVPEAIPDAPTTTTTVPPTSSGPAEPSPAPVSDGAGVREISARYDAPGEAPIVVYSHPTGPYPD